MLGLLALLGYFGLNYTHTIIFLCAVVVFYYFFSTYLVGNTPTTPTTPTLFVFLGVKWFFHIYSESVGVEMQRQQPQHNIPRVETLVFLPTPEVEILVFILYTE